MYLGIYSIKKFAVCTDISDGFRTAQFPFHNREKKKELEEN